MTEMIPVREAAKRWNITERRVSTLCKNGKIDGAEKQGKRWMIPKDAQKPADQRIRTGVYRKAERPAKLPLHPSTSTTKKYGHADRNIEIIKENTR